MSSLTLKQRIRLINYCYKIGFIIDLTPYNQLNDNLKIKRIKKLINDGYRITIVNNKPEYINIKGEVLNQEVLIDLQCMYYELMNNEVTKK